VNKIDDATLMAYADGELDPETARSVDQRLAEDSVLARRVAGLRQDAATLKAAFQHILYEPPAADAFVHFSTTSKPEQPSTLKRLESRGPILAWAVAASLAALMVGGILGLQLAKSDQRSAFQQMGAPTPSDHQAFNESLSSSLETSVSGTATVWNNPDTGHAGEVIPVRTFKAKSGQFCREFVATSSVFGSERESGGVACRRADGTWKIRVQYYPDI